MSAELTEHLGYEPHHEPPGGTGNTRNGTSPKTLATEHKPVEIKTPLDRKSTFTPKIVRRASAGSRDSTRRSSRCTRVGSRCATLDRG